MKTKEFEVELKALTDGVDGDGRFTGYAAVFDNIDSAGDKIIKGAFAESLADYETDGAGIPCYWRHRLDDPFMNIGATVSAKEDDRGLLVDVQLDLDTNNGKQTYRLLKQKRVAQMSFAYDVLEGGWIETEEESYYELRKLRIHEVSVVPIGANQETEILTVKSAVDQMVADVKAGDTITSDIQDQIRGTIGVLETILGSKTEQENADGKPEAKDEEPEGVKSEEPKTDLSAEADAVNQFIQTL